MPAQTPLVVVTILYAIRMAISFVHGHAHDQLAVPLAPWQQVFVWGVIVIAPTAVVAYLWFRPSKIAAWALTALLAAGWIFELYFHFGPPNSDHVDAMPAVPERAIFVQTAVALAVVEPIVAVAAGWLALAISRQRGTRHA